MSMKARKKSRKSRPSPPSGGGDWSSGDVTLKSGEHKYTAVATQESPIGNGPGHSETVPFEVDTEPPKIVLNKPPAESNNTTPTFSGTTNAGTQVTVHVYEGTKEVAKVTAQPPAGGGEWTSGHATLATGKHNYTAEATQESPIGNGRQRNGELRSRTPNRPRSNWKNRRRPRTIRRRRSAGRRAPAPR